MTTLTSRQIFIGLLFASFIITAAYPQVMFMREPARIVAPATRTGSVDKIKTVAVISGIGSVLTISQAEDFLGQRGTHNDGELDIKDWKIDDEVVTLLSERLRKKFNVKEVTFDPVSLRQVTNLAWYSGEEARKYLRRFPTAGLDAFIVVRAMTQEIARGERGLSVTKSIAGRNEGLLETANYVIDVIDCHQWKIIARVHSRLQFRVGGYPSFPIRIASRGVSVSEKSAMNEAEREKLHSDFTKLISSSLIATLRDTNLGIDLPPIGSREIISTPDDEDLYGNIKSVAVASAIGDRLAFIREEPVLAESNPPLEISEWKFDDQIEQMTRGELSKRFTIKNISINRDALMASQIADDAGNYTPAFSGLQTTSDVDAYVVIIKHPPSFAAYDGRVVGNEPGSRGIGLWRTKVLGYDAHINAYLSYAVAVIDARTLKIIRWSESTASPKYAQALPLQEVDSKLWTTNSATLTTDQREVIRQNLVTLINDSIPETLLHLRLGGMMVTDTPILSK